jgi:AraC-like DNA-binding protein
VYGWDQSQARTWDGICRHTALSALAQLRAAAIRDSLTGSITLPPAGYGDDHAGGISAGGDVSDADLQIPLGDAPVPGRGGQPCPAGIAPIKLSIAETARLARLAARYAAGLISRARLAFMLRWSRRRRCHQAAARWYDYSARLLTASG